MEMPMTLQPTVYEQKLLRIVRRLPPERVTQVIDFLAGNPTLPVRLCFLPQLRLY